MNFSLSTVNLYDIVMHLTGIVGEKGTPCLSNSIPLFFYHFPLLSVSILFRWQSEVGADVRRGGGGGGGHYRNVTQLFLD